MTREELIAENWRLTKLVERLYRVNDELIAVAEKQQGWLDKKGAGLWDVSCVALVGTVTGLILGASVAWLVMRFV